MAKYRDTGRRWQPEMEDGAVLSSRVPRAVIAKLDVIAAGRNVTRARALRELIEEYPVEEMSEAS